MVLPIYKDFDQTPPQSKKIFESLSKCIDLSIFKNLDLSTMIMPIIPLIDVIDKF